MTTEQSKKLTPFEKAQLNAKLNSSRMTLCARVQELVETLEEVQKLRNLPESCSMYDETCLKIAEEEEERIMKSLTAIASLMEAYGISAKQKQRGKSESLYRF